MSEDSKPEKVFRMGLWWDAEEWSDLEQARDRYNAENHLELNLSSYLRYIVRRHLGERVAAGTAADEQRSGSDRRKVS